MHFSWRVFILCLLTTLLLQILSNLANDYGDSEKGADNEMRIGPKRAVHAGFLTSAEMQRGILVCTLLCLMSGIALIIAGTRDLQIGYGVFFFALGIGAILSAIGYTVGKNAYGYRGLGDLFVLLFFGFTGVCGSYYLLSHILHYSVLLPAFTIGAFAAGVLNLNNMRDRESDEKAGKRTLVVKMGLPWAKDYHSMLIVFGFIASLLYVILNLHSSMQFLFLITIPLFRRHVSIVRKITQPAEFDPLLKQLAISTFIFSILFGLGMIIGAYT
jgi:1,4-dihydroxy-2-naphthoate polyprenyltransferase